MPKIIFRPNPTPPPFPPPAPSYDTHYYALSEYQYFDSEKQLSLKFSPCSYPEFRYVEIYVNDNRIALDYEGYLPTENFEPFDTEAEGSAPFQGRIEFYKTDTQGFAVLLHSAPIDVSFAG